MKEEMKRPNPKYDIITHSIPVCRKNIDEEHLLFQSVYKFEWKKKNIFHKVFEFTALC